MSTLQRRNTCVKGKEVKAVIDDKMCLITFPPVTLADRPGLLQRLLGVLWSV